MEKIIQICKNQIKKRWAVLVVMKEYGGDGGDQVKERASREVEVKENKKKSCRGERTLVGVAQTAVAT